MATLYELTGAARDLYEMLSAGEIDEQTFNDTLESIGAEDKVESYCRIIRQLEADIETEIDSQIAVYEKEIERLKGKKLAKQGEIERMKMALGHFIRACGGEKQRGKMFTAFLRKTKSLIYDESSLDKKYLKEVTKNVVDKDAIKKALDAGEDVFGAEYVEKESVQIR